MELNQEQITDESSLLNDIQFFILEHTSAAAELTRIKQQIISDQNNGRSIKLSDQEIDFIFKATHYKTGIKAMRAK